MHRLLPFVMACGCASTPAPPSQITTPAQVPASQAEVETALPLQPIDVRMEVQVGFPLVYRFRGRATATGTGGAPQRGDKTEEVELSLLLEQPDGGAVTARVSEPGRDEAIPIPSEFLQALLPVAENLGEDVQTQEHRIPLPELDVSRGRELPTIETQDQIRLVSREGNDAVVHVERAFSVGEFGNGTMDITAHYDPSKGRYETAEATFTFHLTMAPHLGAGESLVIEGTFSAAYDDEASQVRVARLAAIEQFRQQARDTYDAYRAAHTRDQELDLALQNTDEQLLRFHERASGEALWQRILGLPDSQRDAFLTQASYTMEQPVPPRMTRPLKRALRAVSSSDIHQPTVPGLVGYVVQHPQPAFRRELERFERDGTIALQARARNALEQLNPPDPGQLVVAIKEGRSLNRLVEWVSAVDDPRAIVGALLEYLEAELPTVPAGTSGGPFAIGASFHAFTALELLRRTAFGTFGNDLAAWRTYYDAHTSLPYPSWILEATEHTSSQIRVHALEALGRRQSSDSAEAAALRALQENPEANVQLAAAATLLRWGNETGLPRLVLALESPVRSERELAFLTLATIGETSLGYNLRGTEEQRAEGAARWGRWLELRQATP